MKRRFIYKKQSANNGPGRAGPGRAGPGRAGPGRAELVWNSNGPGRHSN